MQCKSKHVLTLKPYTLAPHLWARKLQFSGWRLFLPNLANNICACTYAYM